MDDTLPVLAPEDDARPALPPLTTPEELEIVTLAFRVGKGGIEPSAAELAAFFDWLNQIKVGMMTANGVFSGQLALAGVDPAKGPVFSRDPQIVAEYQSQLRQHAARKQAATLWTPGRGR